MCEWAPCCGFHRCSHQWGSQGWTGIAVALSPASLALPWLPWPLQWWRWVCQVSFGGFFSSLSSSVFCQGAAPEANVMWREGMLQQVGRISSPKPQKLLFYPSSQPHPSAQFARGIATSSWVPGDTLYILVHKSSCDLLPGCACLHVLCQPRL